MFRMGVPRLKVESCIPVVFETRHPAENTAFASLTRGTRVFGNGAAGVD
jgi:hypothetical protein